MRLILTFGFFCWAATLVARADVDWRVSIKLIADAEGNPPPRALENLTDRFTEANRILTRLGRGYGFDVVEVITITNLPGWHHASVTPENRSILQGAIRANPAFYAYRSDAINIYVTSASDFGICSFPFNPSDDILLMSHTPDTATLLQELGHYFNLRDTFHGEDFRYNSGTDCSPPDPCDCAIQDPGEEDGALDTAPDNHCFVTTNVLAYAVYGNVFTNLTAGLQERVLNTFFNIMSCRPIRDRLTDDQLDRMTSDSNTRRRNVATGLTWFVATDGSDANSGKASYSRFQTVTKAFAVAHPRDMVLLRAGTYTAPQTINQPITIRASRGNVKLVR